MSYINSKSIVKVLYQLDPQFKERYQGSSLRLFLYLLKSENLKQKEENPKREYQTFTEEFVKTPTGLELENEFNERIIYTNTNDPSLEMVELINTVATNYYNIDDKDIINEIEETASYKTIHEGERIPQNTIKNTPRIYELVGVGVR